MRKLRLLIILCFAICAFAQQNIIPPQSTIFIEPNEGFETYLTAAFQKKHVPLAIVIDKSKADFVLTSTIQRGDKPSWSQTIFLGKTKANEDASIQIINLKTSAVAFAYSVHKYNAKNGQQSAAEACAKHIGNFVKKGTD